MTEWITPPSWALSLSERLLKEAPGDVPLTEVFAAGLAAERERAAKRCEGDFDREMSSYGGYFANAIRKGEE